MRKLGVGSPTEPLVGAYATELRSTDGGKTILPRDERMVVAGVRLPVGKPVELGFTAVRIALLAPASLGMVGDLAAVALVGDVDDCDTDLLVVADPVRQYRLRFPTKSLAAEAVQLLTEVCRARLDGLPQADRAWWLIRHADAFSQVDDHQRAADLYGRVAASGVQPHAGTAAMNYGLYLKKEGSLDEARKYFFRALESGAANVAAQSAMLLGFDSRKRGDDASAREFFVRAAALGDPRGAETIALMDEQEQGQ
jgi:Tfp pilus assembly protein PilF